MENKDMASPSGRAFVPSGSSPQAVSPVPASIPDAVARVQKHVEQLRSWVENSETVRALLQPQMALFDAREGGWNTYAVRMAVALSLAKRGAD